MSNAAFVLTYTRTHCDCRDPFYCEMCRRIAAQIIAGAY